LYSTADEIRFDLDPVDVAKKGQHISIAMPQKVRRNDKLFVVVENN
jgi:putative protease